MKAEWKSFLENVGAEFDQRLLVNNFGNQVRETRIVFSGDVLAVLSHFGLIAVHGQDAESFLQGQLTNDVREVNETQSQLNALCNSKGRIITNFRLFKRNDIYYLRLPVDMVEDTVRRLKMYVLRSKVNIENATDKFASMGFSGPNAEKELAGAKLNVPAEVNQVIQTDSLCLIRTLGPHPRFEIFGDLDAMKKLWTALDVRGAPVGTSSWQLLDIHSGIATVRPETSEEFVPQMLNLQIVGAISFKKGCYTGQEIIARMQYLGKLKRRMYRAHIGKDLKPVPGEKLYSSTFSNEQACGMVVNSQPSTSGGYDLLAVVETKCFDANDVHVSSLEGPQLKFDALPYAFDEDQTAAKS